MLIALKEDLSSVPSISQLMPVTLVPGNLMQMQYTCISASKTLHIHICKQNTTHTHKKINESKNIMYGTGEMAQWLRALTAIPGDLTLLHRHMCRQNTSAHKTLIVEKNKVEEYRGRCLTNP